MTVLGLAPALASGLATGAAVAGTAIQAMGQLSAGAAAQETANYNAEVATRNAQQAQQDAAATAAQQQEQNKQKIGEIVADYGASGVDPNSVSSLSVLWDQTRQGELARQLDLYRGQTAAAGYQSTAALDTLSGQQRAEAGAIGAGSSLLTGAAKTGFTIEPPVASAPATPGTLASGYSASP